MRFNLPQFIERETKVVGPLTLKQFIFIGVAGAICFFFYFTAPFGVFLLSIVFVGVPGFALAFWKVRGIPLPTVISNFFKFTLASKVFTWKKGGEPVIFKKIEIKEEKKDELPLKIVKNSKLKSLKLKVETKK